jgi:hypothetical protein
MPAQRRQFEGRYADIAQRGQAQGAGLQDLYVHLVTLGREFGHPQRRVAQQRGLGPRPAEGAAPGQQAAQRLGHIHVEGEAAGRLGQVFEAHPGGAWRGRGISMAGENTRAPTR